MAQIILYETSLSPYSSQRPNLNIGAPEILRAICARSYQYYFEDLSLPRTLDKILQSGSSSNPYVGAIFNVVNGNGLYFDPPGEKGSDWPMFIRIIRPNHLAEDLNFRHNSPRLALNGFIFPTTPVGSEDWPKILPGMQQINYLHNAILNIYQHLFLQRSPVIASTKPFLYFLSGRTGHGRRENDPSWRTIFGVQVHPNQTGFLLTQLCKESHYANLNIRTFQKDAQGRISAATRLMDFLSSRIEDNFPFSLPMLLIAGDKHYSAGYGAIPQSTSNYDAPGNRVPYVPLTFAIPGFHRVVTNPDFSLKINI